MAQILIFGDSITFGAWDKHGGWAQRLKTLVDTKIVDSNFNYYHEVYLLGISGNTTEDILHRFTDEVNARLDEDSTENIILFAIGINDSQYIHDLKSHKVDKKKFEENIHEMILLAKQYTNKIIFVGLTPVDESKTDPTPWGPKKSYKNEYIEQYDAITEGKCAKEKVHFIHMYDVLKNHDHTSLLVDGLHPNTKGHEVMYENILKYLMGNRLL